MAKYRIPLQILLLLFLSGCDLFKSANKTEQLPPATQEGKNTFGCLVNGKVWLPNGNDGTSNLDLSYDPTFYFGTFNLSAYRLEDIVFQSITLYSDSLKSVGIYPLVDPKRQSAFYTDIRGNCEYTNDPDVTHTGIMTITRFDLSQQIIAGTFEFTVTKTNCPLIVVTEGRFDMKF